MFVGQLRKELVTLQTQQQKTSVGAVSDALKQVCVCVCVCVLLCTCVRVCRRVVWRPDCMFLAVMCVHVVYTGTDAEGAQGGRKG